MPNIIDTLPFKELVARRCGLTLKSVGKNSLSDAIGKRMGLTSVTTSTEYFNKIILDEKEFHELIALLTINETYFFREQKSLSILTDCLLPRLLAQAGNRFPLRILSAGCSTGEEPYSIAIALLEKFGERALSLFSVVACDIDYQALAKARLAQYTSFSFRGFPENLMRRYFASGDDNCHVPVERVRSLVEFHHVNLLSETAPLPFQDLSVVFFRNVSIYFDAPTRRTIQQKFRSCMNDAGFLILGATETLANDLGIFSLIEEDGCFYFATNFHDDSRGPEIAKLPHESPKPMPGAAYAPGQANAANPPAAKLDAALFSSKTANTPLPTAIALPPLDAANTTTNNVRKLILEKKIEEALQIVARIRIQDSSDLRFLLFEAYIRMQRKEYSIATTLAQEAMKRDNWSAEAAMLLGLVAKWENDTENAIRCFKQVVYTRNDCWPAHYYLAELHRMKNNVDLARRAYKLVLQQIGTSQDPDGGLFLPLGLPLADIRVLCKLHSTALDSPRPKGGR